MSARAVNLSHTGMGVQLDPHASLPVGSLASLTISWDDFEATTFDIEVVNVTSERGQRVMGVVFVRPNPEQNEDLIRHLYSRIENVERQAA